MRYILPHLPRAGRFPITELRRASLRHVQAELLRSGLAKETIDGAFSALSAMLRDAVDDELLDANPAHGIRVRPNDPRLNPTRTPRERRAVPPDEVGAFIAAVPDRYRAVCWCTFLSGVRPGELFALARSDLDRKRQMIYVHQTVNRYGTLEPGLKTTHHVRDRGRRGRWTLFPASLIGMVESVPADIEGRLFASPRGFYWAHRNFYRNVWEPAQAASRTGFTLYDARHTFSSRLLAAGIPLVEVSSWMGHSLRAGGEHINTTTRKYAHATGEHTKTALRELEEFVAVAEAGNSITRRA
jgi:integrase